VKAESLATYINAAVSPSLILQTTSVSLTITAATSFPSNLGWQLSTSACSGISAATAANTLSATTTPQTISSGTLSAGSYVMCMQAENGNDFVAQTSFGTLVVAAAADYYTDIAVTANTANPRATTAGKGPITITVTPASTPANTNGYFIFLEACNSNTDGTGATQVTATATQAVVISSGLGVTGQVGDKTFKLCFDADGSTSGWSFTEQLAANTRVTVKAESVATYINAAVHPGIVVAGTSHTLTIAASSSFPANLRWQISATGTACSGITAATATGALSGTGTPQTIASGVLTAGTYQMCMQAADGNDFVAQTNFGTLYVNAAAASGSDPVTTFGGKKYKFTLPLNVYVPLISTSEFVLHGSTFEGGGSWEQWFDRMLVTSLDGQRWVSVAVKKNLLSFNKSSAPKRAFQSLEVTLGHGSVDKPSVVSVVEGPDVIVPYDWLNVRIRFKPLSFYSRFNFDSVRSLTIGKARRECVEIEGQDLALFVCTSPANEYYGNFRYLSIVYAHLDVAVQDISNYTCLDGLLPQLWGLKPLSETNRKYSDDESEVAQETHAETNSTMAWAGGNDSHGLPIAARDKVVAIEI